MSTQKLTIAILALAVCSVSAVAAPPGVIMPYDEGTLLPSSSVEPQSADLRGFGPGFQVGADHIVGFQCLDGGWGWPHEACPTTTFNNITGPIALGLLHAHSFTGDPDHLAAAVAGGDFDLTFTYPNTEFRFGAFAPYFLWQLGGAHATHAETEFFDELTAKTYGPSDLDTHAWIASLQAARSGSLINLRPWDLHLLPAAAAALGNPDSTTPLDGVSQQDAFRDAVLDGLNTLKQDINPVSDFGDIIGLAGGVRGLAFNSSTTFVAIVSPNHPDINGISTLCDLADVLAGYQNPDGSWNWFSDPGETPTESDKDVQSSAYAVLALVAAEAEGCGPYTAQIDSGRDWIRSMQLPDGGFVSWPGGPSNIEVEGEALNALVPDSCTDNVLAFLVSAGSECVQPSETIEIELHQLNLTGDVRGFQAFAQFDTTGMSHVSNVFTSSPYGQTLLNFVSGENIDLAAGIDNLGGQLPTNSNALLVTLSFNADTEGPTVVSFRAHTPPSRFTDPVGQEVTPCLIESPTILIDGTDPVITCPIDVIVECDESTDPSNTGEATATDNLDDNPLVEFSDVEDLDDCDGTGTITRTWTATDCAGNTTSCVQIITVVDTTEPVITCPDDVTVECDESTAPAAGAWSVQNIVDNDDEPFGLGQGPGDGRPRNVRGMALSPDGNYLYLGYNQKKQLRKIDLSVTDPADSCAVVAELYFATLTAPEQAAYTGTHMPDLVDNPKAVATDDVGRVYATRTTEIQVFDADLTTKLLTITGTGPSSSIGVNGIHVERKGPGEIYVYAAVRGLISGEARVYRMIVLESAMTGGSVSLASVLDPAFDGDGIVDVGLDSAGNASDDLRGLASDMDGNVWVAENDGTLFEIVPAAGDGASTILKRALAGAFDVAIDGDRVLVASGSQTLTVVDRTDISVILETMDPFAPPLGLHIEKLAEVGTSTGVDFIPGGPIFLAIEGGSSTPVGFFNSTFSDVNCDGPDPNNHIDDDNDPILRFEAGVGEATATDNCDVAPEVTHSDVETPGACPQEKTITRTWQAEDECGNMATCEQIITVEDTTPPAFEFVPPDTTIECSDSLVPSGLYGVATGGVAVYYNSNGGGENPLNQAFLKAQIDGTNDPSGGVAGAPFVFSNAPLVGGNPFSWQDLYSGLVWPESQFGLDFVLEAPTNDATVPTPDLDAYDNTNNTVAGRALVGSVTWAINDYKPHVPDISAGDVINSIVRSQFSAIPAVDVEITQLDLTQVGPIFTIDIAGKLVSTGIHNWFNPATTHSPMANFGLNGDFFFFGTLTYDSTGDPGTDLIDFYEGTIELYANSPTTQLEFARATDNCDPLPVVTFSDDLSGLTGCNGTGTILRTWTATDACGNSTSVVQTITVVDTTPPVLVDCPDDITVPADAGGCDALVTFTEPTATDNCDGSPVVVCDWPSGSIFPTGTTPVTCTATDGCGNASSCGFNVTVENVNELSVTVELEPNIDPPGTLTRCITFELWDCGGPSSVEVSAEVDFTVTAGVPNVAIGTAVIDVPCGVYTCITARDKLHTLRRTDETFGIVGTQYVADFTGNPGSGGDWLIGGNLNDDFFIDILDFGTFSFQFGLSLSADTTCLTAAPHSDISGDGLVDNLDFSFILNNFLEANEANCCGQPLRAADGGAGDGPVTSITVRELRRRGLFNLAAGDLNNDRVLDVQDIAAFLDGARPRPVRVEPVDAAPIGAAIERK